mmetsp:Transcript_8536/g.18075  ORF Transcript_8536/g.18075 Transcript_8536/m.18075 type:complete len:237 (-) Transcript_8536:254-964(-)|eukprot:CAMPEP_0183315292 /NCGR_PEP_ID=MMETSP0160_2-20130417/51252_1 /TAXON_ID=2839 ORGANISM="Odontella Sinensis, Strain Grunow 1884" /NCGR_SAMPLE_ID=MMETSP0160_2 /ASSEMBLY_ACC=CAM_ASM_000250 /LENGTH=236 /DNA_ID=CAMNT_0025480811 /DNA_START=107 /DNA_END=817 /DNA_ORIENTATION=+
MANFQLHEFPGQVQMKDLSPLKILIGDEGETCSSGGIMSLSRTLNHNAPPKEVKLQDASSEAVMAVATFLLTNRKITQLTITDSSLDNECYATLSCALKHNRSITHLTISNCGMNNQNVSDIARALQCNSVLQHLDLSDNMIGDMGAVALALMLRTNTSLCHLDLFSNAVRISGANSIALALEERNKTITFVGLVMNPICESSVYGSEKNICARSVFYRIKASVTRNKAGKKSLSQ